MDSGCVSFVSLFSRLGQLCVSWSMQEGQKRRLHTHTVKAQESFFLQQKHWGLFFNLLSGNLCIEFLSQSRDRKEVKKKGDDFHFSMLFF